MMILIDTQRRRLIKSTMTNQESTSKDFDRDQPKTIKTNAQDSAATPVNDLDDDSKSQQPKNPFPSKTGKPPPPSVTPVAQPIMQIANESRVERRRRILVETTRRAKALGAKLKNMSPTKWIDDLEHYQELADDLEKVNSETNEDVQRHQERIQAGEACLQAIKDHLHSFLSEHPEGTYEEWIEELHPENVAQHEESKLIIDHRFYVKESDHLILWNETVRDGSTSSRQCVSARCSMSSTEMDKAAS